MIENLKVSADSAFSFWVIESKRKRRIGGVSRKNHFRRKESDQSHFFWKKSKLFNFEDLAKIKEKRAFIKY